MTDARADDDLVGRIVKAPNGRGRIIVCSRLLDLALVDFLDSDDQPTGRRGVLHTLKTLEWVH